MAVQIAFPLGEEVRDDRLKLARQDARLEIRKHPALHGLQYLRCRPVPLAGLNNGIVRGDIICIEFVKKSGLLREDRRGQSKRVSRLVFRPHQCGVAWEVVWTLLQKIVEWHIQAKRLRRQCR